MFQTIYINLKNKLNVKNVLDRKGYIQNVCIKMYSVHIHMNKQINKVSF